MVNSGICRSLLLLLITLSLTLSAAAAGWSKWVKISTIQVSNVNNTPGVWLTFGTAPFTSHACSIKDGQYKLGGGADNINKMMSLATEAHSKSRDVVVHWEGGCSGGGANGYPVLVGITIK